MRIDGAELASKGTEMNVSDGGKVEIVPDKVSYRCEAAKAASRLFDRSGPRRRSRCPLPLTRAGDSAYWRPLVVVLTSFDSSAREPLLKAAHRVGIRASLHWRQDTTHVVVGTSEEGLTKKILLGAAHALPIVKVGGGGARFNPDGAP